MNTIKQQVNLFFLALSFFSRLPVPKNLEYSPQLLNQSGRYFSLVGLLIGIVLIAFYSIVSLLFPISIAIILLMVASLLLTGAFHEDGLADMADGIGGGLTISERLAIMKDSRLGTYGTVTLVCALALKYSLLVELAQQQLILASILVGYALSRATAASLIFDMTYVSDSDTSKSKPLAMQQTIEELYILLIIGALPLMLLPFNTILIIAILLIMFRVTFKYWLNKRIGGYTGDCLGGAQQLTELLIYLVIVASSTGALL
ncbi:adenosylcobinamide-GDP ribazoletransferase [Thalassotalea psychrophila]|uniref:Adenosylcobinamide-GDP ribazoletransferase n=1 Tax=Thalassotalea psychrophila TaxID=3065647 RepID=A0ABY9TPS8_9GAMM|nr:adenosylcobinamide-GDP ribazoletransferase [Colwelliaceae bacterium SQ149]